MDADRRDERVPARVTATGALHELPSADVATNTCCSRRTGVEAAVVPRHPDAARRIDVGRGQREEAEVANRQHLDLRDLHRRDRSSRLRRARRDAPIRLPPQLKITTSSPVGRTPGNADSASRPIPTGADQLDAAVATQLPRPVAVGGVRVHEVAAAVVRARGAVVAGDPVLVEGHALDEAPSIAITGLLHVKPSLERLIVRRVSFPGSRASR